MIIPTLSTLAGLSVLLALPPAAQGAPMLSRDAKCPSYLLIEARGTGEPQGPSLGFKTMNARILATVPNGTDYPVVYPADPFNQVDVGVRDIIREINARLADDPDTCFVLQGYSQGATVITETMNQLSGAPFDAVKAAILIGDTTHKPNLDCNVDGEGGNSTKAAIGVLSAFYKGVPDSWVSKTKDICIFGDGVCDSLHGIGTTAQHFFYPFDSSVQNIGATFAIDALQ
ncbi:hypothetical protein EX895_003178 [Sporisorium graminicola]|uniref:Cutinase n=1 Tax=Sporisorium graminicola TaxID=280036 RepID=A0A4U7KYV3_9BASI|nr:hypothetical protein EX895_003178 [Sporisorium graminicola]TKY88082.1 hypothetical protein EX895_003178 [Sporisorium graminicola]